jgi:hypothetical protein
VELHCRAACWTAWICTLLHRPLGQSGLLLFHDPVSSYGVWKICLRDHNLRYYPRIYMDVLKKTTTIPVRIVGGIPADSNWIPTKLWLRSVIALGKMLFLVGTVLCPVLFNSDQTKTMASSYPPLSKSLLFPSPFLLLSLRWGWVATARSACQIPCGLPSVCLRAPHNWKTAECIHMKCAIWESRCNF